MEKYLTDKNYSDAISQVSQKLKIVLSAVKHSIKVECSEIRLRMGKPIILVCKNKNLFLHPDGTVDDVADDFYICTYDIISDTFSRMCNYSVHAHLSDVVNGFISLSGGHRVGIVGTAATNKNGEIISVRNITSLNIRIAREILDCSSEMYLKLFKNKMQSIIIAGPPACGKTTVLRDLIRKISDSGIKVSVIDERHELSCQSDAVNSFNLGYNSDIFVGYPKTESLNIALRTMSPQVIAIDEVVKRGEIEAISTAANCGVKLIVTVHASSYNEILNKPQTEALINTGAFDKLVLLMGPDSPGKISGIFDIRELRDEIIRCRINLGEPYVDWSEDVLTV